MQKTPRIERVRAAGNAMLALLPADRASVIAALPQAPEQCTAPECPKVAEKYRDLCSGHRKRLQRTGSLGKDPINHYRPRRTADVQRSRRQGSRAVTA